MTKATLPAGQVHTNQHVQEFDYLKLLHSVGNEQMKIAPVAAATIYGLLYCVGFELSKIQRVEADTSGTIPTVRCTPCVGVPNCWDEKRQTTKIIPFLRKFDGWNGFVPRSADHERDRYRLEVLLKKLNTLPTASLRTQIEAVGNDKKSFIGQDTWALYFFINRYVFAVPSENVRPGSRFGSFLAPPMGAAPGTWPLLITDDGNISVAPGFGGYSGPPYKYLEEFDYFATTYGRRSFHQAKTKTGTKGSSKSHSQTVPPCPHGPL